MTAPATIRRYFTPPDIAEALGCNHTKILGWIKSGELRAVNVAARPLILAKTGEQSLDSNYFTQKILPRYIAEHAEGETTQGEQQRQGRQQRKGDDRQRQGAHR